MAKKSIPKATTKSSANLEATQAVAREAWQIAYAAYKRLFEVRAMFHAIRTEVGECPRSAATRNAVALAGIGKTIAGQFAEEFDAAMTAVRDKLRLAGVPEERVEGM